MVRHHAAGVMMVIATDALLPVSSILGDGAHPLLVLLGQLDGLLT